MPHIAFTEVISRFWTLLFETEIDCSGAGLKNEQVPMLLFFFHYSRKLPERLVSLLAIQV